MGLAVGLILVLVRPGPPAPAIAGAILIGILVVVLVARDVGILHFSLPGVHRQVRRDITRLDSRLASISFGFELGTGVRTQITSSAPYMALVLLILLDPGVVAVVAAFSAFGIARGSVALDRALRRDRDRWDRILRAAGRRILPAGTTLLAGVTAILLVACARPPAIAGVLPDGTPFSIMGLDPAYEPVSGVTAVVVFDVPGEGHAIGITTFAKSTPAEQPSTEWDGDELRMVDENWVVKIEVYPEGLERLQSLGWPNGVGMRVEHGLPILELPAGLRFAVGDEVPSSLEVVLGTVVVRRSCGPEAIACDDNGLVQVIPLANTIAPAPPAPKGEITISS